jgi:hypothetical protein
MDSQHVSPEYLRAGADYLVALKKLGLKPLFLGWGREIKSSQWLLVMVTSIIDAGGPLALNNLLLRAYNAEATPKAISPFIVRVYSPDAVRSEFLTLAVKGKGLRILQRDNKTPVEGISFSNLQFEFHGVAYEMINAYALAESEKVWKPNYHANLGEWQRFKRNVERLAA